MRKLSNYIDDYGMICQRDILSNLLDGGDSANRISLFLIASQINNGFTGEAELVASKEECKDMFDSMVVELESSEGIWKRHPDPREWYSRPEYFSRDQQRPLIIALGLAKNVKAVKDTLKKQIKRWGFYQNFRLFAKDVDGKRKIVQGDIPSPLDWGYFIRALGWWWAYPLILISDLFLLLSSIIIVKESKLDPDKTTDDLGHIAALLQAKNSLPTPISWFARIVYSGRLNAGKDIANRLPGFGPQTALDHYFRQEKDITDSPPINELFLPFLERELK